MVKNKKQHKPFKIKDCALAATATGSRAQSLNELRDFIRTVDSGSIYYHFWGGLLRPRFDDPEYNNDFASWAQHALHDKILAERLSVLDPTEIPDMEKMRAELVDIIEERLDEIEHVSWTSRDQEFHFIRSQIVVFDTDNTIEKAEDLVAVIPSLTSSSVFYHFIDARRRTFGNIDDFSSWLYGFEGKYSKLCESLGTVDPFFSTLPALRNQLSSIVDEYFSKGGL